MKPFLAPIALPLPLSGGRRTRRNKITPEAQPIRPGVAAISDAFTFARTSTKEGGTTALLVTSFEGSEVEAVDLTAFGARDGGDAFDALDAIGEQVLKTASETAPRRLYALKDLLPSGSSFERHVATGTNFAEHAKEAGINRVFNFPKFGAATPPLSSVAVNPGTLMDYEVEISVRFDRDVRSLADFEKARKGFFLCGDFTDRATLLRLIDRNNVASGRGFSDAKSGPDWFPTGPFLVVPHDWREYVRRERIVTRVNGEVRQDARGRSMILDFQALVEKALKAGGGGSYVYRGKPVTLLQDGVIPKGSAVMSGTSEGVLFMPLMREDFVGGMVDHVVLGRFLRGWPLMESLANRFVRHELRAGRYLQQGDVVEHLSSTMGSLSVALVAPGSVR